MEVMEITWNRRVTHHAQRTLEHHRRNKPCLLPVTDDIVKLSAHLQSQAENATRTLSSTSPLTPLGREAWASLNETVLSQCIIFNRRRQGEVSKMKMLDYEKHLKTHEQENFLSALSPLEKELCKKLTRVEVEGKRGRCVPVLLTNEMKRSIDLLLATRRAFGIPEENIFLFPKHSYGSLRHLRGCDCLRGEAEACGAKHPEFLRSTKLRKQMATIAQVVKLGW